MAFSLQAQKLNLQPAVMYDMGNREEAIDNKGPKELFKGFCLLICRKCLLRVPNRFFGIRDLAYFKARIRDFEGKGGRDSGL